MPTSAHSLHCQLQPIKSTDGVMPDSSWINVRASDKQQRANKERRRQILKKEEIRGIKLQNFGL